jgi:NAD(P)-dependent dehydrogenase (short-subunit alcohol dehydrogenase family)
MSEIKTERILVTGGSAGLGRAMVESFLARGADVTAVARDQAKLEAVARLGARVIAGNTCDATFMDRVVKEVMPTVLVLNAGARLNMGTIDTLTFDEFSTNWNTDVKGGFYGIQAALKAPMPKRSRVLLMSSGAAMVLGAPQIPPASLRLSGGYIGAKRMLWFMAHSANAVARERDLDIHFQALLPMQLMAGTMLGHSVASEYATRSGLSVEDYLFQRYGPPMSPAHVGEQVADMLDGPKLRSGVAFGLRPGPEPLLLDV